MEQGNVSGMDRILILKPRLDVTFKEGQVPEERGDISPIRQHWANFIEHLQKAHPDALLMECPLWQMSVEKIQFMNPDIVYVPHKQQIDFPIAPPIEVRYYMQTVFPWLFSIDPVGWEGGSSAWQQPPLGDVNGSHWDELKNYINKGGTKFGDLQPHRTEKMFDQGYILYVCQLPHDETIKYHSDVEVIEALQMCFDDAEKRGIPVVVKGHPVNPGSMTELKRATMKNSNATWVENVNIHDLLEDCSEVHLVNSGVGYEAILHEKKVVAYGRAMYSSVVGGEPDLKLYRQFINGFVDWCYDTKTGRGFDRL